MLLNAILAVAACWLIFRYVRLLSSDVSALLAVALWLIPPPAIRWQLMGMENTLYTLILVWTLLAAHKMLDASSIVPRNAVLFGLVLGLLFLSRVDSTIFILILGSLMTLDALIGKHWIRLKSLLMASLITLVVMIPYLMFSFVAFGRPLPVSGAIKVWFGQEYVASLGGIFSPLFLSTLWQSTSQLVTRVVSVMISPRIFAFLPILAIVVSAWAISFLLWIRLRLRRNFAARNNDVPITSQFGVVEVGFICFVVAHTILNVILFLPSLFWTPWYFAPQFLCLVLFLPMILFPEGYIASLSSLARYIPILTSIKSRLPARTAVSAAVQGGMAMFLLIGPVYVGAQMTREDPLRSHYFVEAYRLISWLNRNVNDDTRLAGWDSGLLGYFSERTLVNLDGVVNDYDYFENFLKVDRVGEYVRQEKIDVIITWGGEDYLCSRPDIACDDVIYRSDDFRVSSGEIKYIRAVQISKTSSRISP